MAGETLTRPNDHLLSAENAALVLIDYQPEQVGTVRSIDHDLMLLNVTAVARAAAAYDLPVVLAPSGSNWARTAERSRRCVPNCRMSRRSTGQLSTPGRTRNSGLRSRPRAARRSS